jgi:hypothetical protein
VTTLSYRDGLEKIGAPAGKAQFYLDFHSRPKSLRTAIKSMDFPASTDWSEPPDIYRDEAWTDEVQGVDWDGNNWIFSTNANQAKPGARDKAIYVFPNHASLKDDSWSQEIPYHTVPHPLDDTDEGDDHWGQITYYQGHVYVAHFWDNDDPRFPGNAQVVVFKDNGGSLSYDRWIELDKPVSPVPPHRQDRAEFQAINPWDGMLYTCFGDGELTEFFVHDMQGKFTGKVLPLTPKVSAVQGACFTPNGHLFISTNEPPLGDKLAAMELQLALAQAQAQGALPGLTIDALALTAKHQMIYYHSVLNGHRLGQITVLSLEGGQEQEGICYAPLHAPDGTKVYIHAILLENRDVSLDNIFLKQFACARPEVI